MSDSVNIIIPTYNMQEYIIQSVNSALAQENVNVEVIVVDDGSTDGTRELLAQSKLLDKVKYVYQENGGLSVARNTGLKYANCEYCCFLDADDLLEPTFCCELINYMQKTESSIVYCDFEYFIEDKIYSKKNFCLPSYSGDVFGKFIMGNFVVVNALLFKRSVLKFNFKPNYYCEDWLYWTYLSLDYPFFFYPRILAKVRKKQNSMSSNHRKMTDSQIKIMYELLPVVESNVPRITRYEHSFFYYMFAFLLLEEKQYYRAFVIWFREDKIKRKIGMSLKLIVKTFLIFTNSYMLVLSLFDKFKRSCN